MKIKHIQQLCKIVSESQISQLEISGWGQYICFRKGTPQSSDLIMRPDVQPIVNEQKSNIIMTELTRETQEQVITKTTPLTENEVIEVCSPMMGAFYLASAPDQPPYVELGDMVTPGQVLCLIEAMKMMNEIQAEVSGLIAEISVENGHSVERNQVLFILEKL